MLIEDIITRPMPVQDVPLRGGTITVRALSAGERDALMAAFPRPVAPMMKDPGRGSDAPEVADENDPGHRAALAEWYRKAGAACVAAVTGMKVAVASGGGGPPVVFSAGMSNLAAWAEAAQKAARAGLTGQEMDRLDRAWRELADPFALKPEGSED